MTDVDSILLRIRVGLAGHGRKSKISRQTGIPRMLLVRLARPDANPTADTMRRVDDALAKLYPAERPAPPHQPD